MFARRMTIQERLTRQSKTTSKILSGLLLREMMEDTFYFLRVKIHDFKVNELLTKSSNSSELYR